MIAIDQHCARRRWFRRLVGKLPGGFIANATCGAARLGLRSAYISWAGDDADADLLADDFRAHGVDPAGLVRVPGAVTPFTVVITGTDARRAILLPESPLYLQPLAPDHLALAERSRVVYTYPRDEQWVALLADAAHAGGGWLALVESAVPLREPRCRARSTARRSCCPRRNAGCAARGSVARNGAPRTVDRDDGRRRGRVGSRREWRSRSTNQRGACRAVDTTGAGDCFHAALIAARWAARHCQKRSRLPAQRRRSRCSIEARAAACPLAPKSKAFLAT